LSFYELKYFSHLVPLVIIKKSIYCSILFTSQATATDLILWGELLSIDSVKVQIAQDSERKRDSVNNLGIVNFDMSYMNSEAKKHINKK
jgi:hypothetical protein